MVQCKGGMRSSGFTLVEVLTVVAIIALLVAILLPSLSKAQSQARNVKVAALLDSIGKALEMFHNDFSHYPDSRVRRDPIAWEGWNDLRDKQLSGAHWLARGLFGHDMAGVDAGGYTMMDASAEGPGLPQTLGSRLLTRESLLEGGHHAGRKGAYMEGEILALDTDRRRFPGTSPLDTAKPGNFKYRPTGRPVVHDGVYGSPILYYRANPTARQPFCCYGGIAAVNVQPVAPGVYNHYDNHFLTGHYDDADCPGCNDWGWDFSGRGQTHRIGVFGTTNPGEFCTETQTFTTCLHDRGAWRSVNTIRPARHDSFVLISAGRDQVFGTEHDIVNFSVGR
jgi:prepilin-type N-terminal cleavage/methylation domain-containing protein